MSLCENLLPGQRAIAIKVTAESLVAGFVLPGTRVDIVHTTHGTDSSARIILQNMMVLAVDTQDVRDPALKTMMGQTVTLAATPEESTRLSVAQANGELRLLLKGGADTKRTTTVVTRISDLAKPLSTDIDKENDGSRTASGTPKVPVLPPVVDDKNPVLVEAKKTEPVKKRKRHVMTINTPNSSQKAVFLLGKGDDDEDDGSSTPATKSDKEAKPNEVTKKPEEPKKPATPAPLNPTPPSAFGKSMRTGRIQ
jgi:Flp pilus assembly protein CpaB